MPPALPHLRHSRLLSRALAFPCLLFAQAQLQAQMPVPQLLKDINPAVGNEDSNPTQFHDVDGKLVFYASAPSGDPRVWRSDGTATGTQLVVQNPMLDMTATWDPTTWIKVGAKWFFTSAPKGGGEMRLWVHENKGFFSLTLGLAAFPSEPKNLTACGGLLYFTVDHGPVGHVLWRSDGTGPGTIPLTLPDPSNAPAGSGWSSIQKLTAGGDMLYFMANSLRLFRSGGTPETTTEVNYTAKLREAPITEIVGADDGIFFTCTGGKNGNLILVKTTGTAEGTIKVGGDDDASDDWRSPRDLPYWNGALYFGAWTPESRNQLYRSDGTTGGTAVVKVISSQAGPLAPRILGTTDTFMFLQADDGKRGTELWRTDGTAKGTYLVKELTKGPEGTYFGNPVMAAGKLWFTGPGKGWSTLWVSDGTAKGTRVVKEFTTPFSHIKEIGSAGGICYLSASDGVHGHELWKSDGSARGTVMVKDLADQGLSGIGTAANVVVFNDHYYFLAGTNKRTGAPQLWSSDGSSTGTVMVPEFSKARSPFWPEDLSAAGGRLMVPVDTRKPPRAIWSTDGTPEGLMQEQNFPASPERDRMAEVDGKSFALIGNALYLLRPGNRSGPLLLAIGVPNFSYRRNPLVTLNGRVCFPSVGTGSQPGLWSSDGTLEGTGPVKLMSGSEPPYELIEFNQALYSLTAHDGYSRLWRSDGTEAGTTLLGESWDGDCRYQKLATCNGKLCMFGSSSNEWLLRLFTTDGSSAPVLQRSLPNASSAPYLIHSTGDELYFSHFSPPLGTALWRTDGTADGTCVLKDIDAVFGTVPPAPPVTVGPWTYFAADDRVHGIELWRTDGTAANTAMVADLLDGPLGSWPQGLRQLGDRLLFTALTHSGRELWALDDAGAAAADAAVSTLLAKAARIGSGVPGEDSEASLLRHAFNVAQSGDTRPMTPATGTSGFPHISASGGVLRVEYLRKKDGSLIYTAQYSASLDAGSFQPMTGGSTVTDIDAAWERVIAEQPYDPSTTPRLFARVEVKSK